MTKQVIELKSVMLPGTLVVVRGVKTPHLFKVTSEADRANPEHLKMEGIALHFVPDDEMVIIQVPGEPVVIVPKDQIKFMEPLDSRSMLDGLGIKKVASKQTVMEARQKAIEAKQAEEAAIAKKEEADRVAQAEKELAAQQQIVKETTPVGNKYIVERDPSKEELPEITLGEKPSVKEIKTQEPPAKPKSIFKPKKGKKK